jgi:DNA helicase HerA-like ATPase
MNEHDLQYHTQIGTTNYRKPIPFYIKDTDRLMHIYAIGKTGVGKSTLLENMAISDIQKGKGVFIIDPHGEIAEDILHYIPKERIEDVIYFNPADLEQAIAFNPLRSIHPDHQHLVASGIISTFKKIWAESWGPRMEYILRFALLTLLEYRHATLLDIQPLLTNQYFRNGILMRIKNPDLLAFWRDEFEKFTPALKAEAVAPILNKIGLFKTSIPLRNIVGQKYSSFTFQDVMDTSKIFIANLSKGKLGSDTSALLGSMLITNLYSSALYRAIQKEEERRPFYLYVDEMHTFITNSFADILAEARKYKLGLFLAHQYINQLPETTRDAIFGNVGTMIAFRVGVPDAEFLEKEFYPVFNKIDIINLPRYSIYLKLMIDGATSQPFSADTLPLTECFNSNKNEVLKASRESYTKLRREVELEIFEHHLPVNNPNTLF